MGAFVKGMTNIIRVFPHKTSYTPTDGMVFIGEPPGLLIPPHDEVHISCVFTWDKSYCEELKYQWEIHTDKPVKLGGPAYGSPAVDFIPGLYVKNGVTFTSRGCDNNCQWCGVPEREGSLSELPITPGNIIQDNNFLQTSRAHKDRVFEMLRSQRGICFKGGLQCSLIDAHFIENAQNLKIKELWLACDTDGDIPAMAEAATKLVNAGFSRHQVRCYALIGDDMGSNEKRLQSIYKAGAMPHAQIYQPPDAKKKTYPSKEWRKFQSMWSRPAATRAHCERGTSMWDFNT